MIQLLTIGWLLFSFAKIDDAAKKEAKAKRVVSVCQESIGLLGSIIFQLATPTYFGEKDPARAKVLVKSLLHRSAELQSLVKDNPEAVILTRRVTRDSRSFIESFDELMRSFDAETGRLFFSEVLTTGEFLEQFKVIWERVQHDLNEIIAMYAPIADEFQPQGVKAREDLRLVIMLILGINILTVVILAVNVNRNTLQRLQILMNNMQSFSRARQDYIELRGTDEISALNQAFKQVADERNKLDEIRKSLQAMISHDIRSPLSAVMLSLGFILEGFGETLVPTVSNRLTRALSELGRLSRLVRTLLDIEKMETGHLDLSIAHHYCVDLVDQSISAVQALAERKKISVETQVDECLVLHCDGDRTIQVLVNLLSNAIKFAPQESTITISCEQAKDSAMRFEVSDQGPGVPADKIGKLFGKFSQLDQPEDTRKEGSGLGLFICKLLIEAQGGQLGYRPSESNGACFWFELPPRLSAATTTT
ncbi:MAG: HAMP domain-containing histidine kinase [Candidatus Obscuribacterales bacterium]|nr:HAMP domain-containing histidine kinase [Candidatus Obscuribacterales bacterium]